MEIMSMLPVVKEHRRGLVPQICRMSGDALWLHGLTLPVNFGFEPTIFRRFLLGRHRACGLPSRRERYDPKRG